MPKYLAAWPDGGDDEEALDRMFRALADRTRRAIVARLARGPATVSQLAEPFAMALPSVVQHLGVLEAARIVSSEKVGRVRTYQLVPDALVPANAWIVAHRGARERELDRLGAFLVGRPAPPPDAPSHHPTRPAGDPT